MSEKNTINRAMIYFSKIGGRLFRNNVGSGWAGKFLGRGQDGIVLIKDARPVKFGLFVGSSDNIGWLSISITQDMVGKKVPVFCAIESKYAKTMVTKAQQNFINEVNKVNGIGLIIRSEEDLEKGITEWKVRNGCL